MHNDAFWWYILLEAREKEAPVLDSLVELSGSIGAEYAEGAEVVRVRAYYRSSHDLGHWLREVNQVLAPWPEITVRDMGKIANRSWHTAWKEAFPPLSVGEGLVVLAPWHKGNEPEGRLPLYIYPGSSFGTGYHESTQIALELLEKYLAPEEELVDVGCGSGILSIGAVKLGASRAWARDFDPAVVEEVLENCRLNDISEEKLSVAVGDLLQGFSRKVSLLTANIVMDPLLELLPQIPEVLLPQGRAIFSGLVVKEKELFTEALEKEGFRVLDALEKNDWWGVIVAYQ
jgi:ribosomal protein L11 methyltransferase